MSLTSGRFSWLTVVAISASLAAGCSKSGLESSFVYSAKTDSLIPEAQSGIKGQAGVKKMVDDRFGNPQHLKAWSKLPIDFGGVTASVGETPSGKAVKEILLQFEEGITSPSGDAVSSVQFVGGAAAGETAAVLSWDAESGKATLVSALTGSPAQGDQVVIGGGEVIRNGRVLYQRHCSHCHGTSGDGAGPTAEYLNPRPRDYRHGVFKFTSTNSSSKASREDLSRILKYGIPGTYMPSFLLLKDDELYAIVEYVRFLAMRGEFERKLVTELSVDYSKASVADQTASGTKRSEIIEALTAFLTEDFSDVANSAGDELAEAWSTADTEEALVAPTVGRVADSPESRRRGRELYLSKCADCHGVSGEGNGPQTTIFEKLPDADALYPEAGLHDEWGNVTKPRNLTQGIYRGGRRPIDLFCRMNEGIKGTKMPAFKTVFSNEDVWHIVNYVLSIPFEAEPGVSPGSIAPATPVAPAAAE
ncbi:MAG: cytochrome c [Planctomyces sp.]|nr:cytochrome c [Planctomyces sp.]